MPDLPPAARPDCEHYWAYHVHDGLSVRLCQHCHEPDWADVRAWQRGGRRVLAAHPRLAWLVARAWLARRPPRLARLLADQRDYEADLARLRPHAPEYERTWGPRDWRRP